MSLSLSLTTARRRHQPRRRFLACSSGPQRAPSSPPSARLGFHLLPFGVGRPWCGLVERKRRRHQIREQGLLLTAQPPDLSCSKRSRRRSSSSSRRGAPSHHGHHRQGILPAGPRPPRRRHPSTQGELNPLDDQPWRREQQ